MTVTDEMVLAGAKALHEDWRASILPGGTNHSMRPIIKDETLFIWDNLHPENRESYLRTSRTALTAALSDQAVVPKEPTPEMIDAASEFHCNGIWYVDDVSLFGGLYKAMIAAAPRGGE
jgi:hypothetical protein